MRTIIRYRAVVLGVFLTAALAPAVAQLGPPSAEASTRDDTAWVEYTSMRIVEPSSGWPGSVQADAAVAAELAEDGDNFLGSFVSADGKVTLVAGTDEGHRVASQNARLGTGVVVEQAGLTSEEAQRLGDQVRSLS